MMGTATAAFVMTICEQTCAGEVYQQSDASDADRLVEMNFERHKQPMHGFASHQKRHDRQHHRAGESAQHTDFPRAKAETRVARLRSCEMIGQGRYQKCNHMCAHVPAVG